MQSDVHAPSTVTCQTDVQTDVEVDVPVPAADTSSSPSGQKRRHEGPEGGDSRRDDPVDPVAPVDEVGSLEVPRVLMLGERKHRPGRFGEGLHPGAYGLCELFSPPRVSATASKRGLRGGWSLDLNHTDPVTGATAIQWCSREFGSLSEGINLW